MIFIELVFDVLPENRDQVVELARRPTAETRQERGAILYRFSRRDYRLSRNVEFPDRFVLTELWESEDDLQAHFPLLGDPRTDQVSIALTDKRTGESLAFGVDPSQALSAFHHPYVYAADASFGRRHLDNAETE